MTYAAAEVLIFIISYGILYFTWAAKDKIYKPVIRYLLCTAFAVYIVGIVHFTLFYRDIGNSIHYELALFWSYQVVWEEFSISMWWEIVNNILLFVPMGVLLPLMFKKYRELHQVVFISLVCSITIEICQLVFRIGLFEFDDMFNNTMGGCLGYGMYHMWHMMTEKPKGWQRKMGGWLAGIIVASSYFYVMRMKCS